MPLFLINSKDIISGHITLKGDDAHHLIKVLRAKKGDVITLADEQGQAWQGRLKDNRNVMIERLEKNSTLPPPLPVHLNLALLKKDKMEWVIQKAVELNIAGITLFKSARSVRTEISPAYLDRLHKIARTAQKQCGRPFPLQISNVPLIGELCAMKQEGIHFFYHQDIPSQEIMYLYFADGSRHGVTPRQCSPEGSALAGGPPPPCHPSALHDFLSRCEPLPAIRLWIGPEGGWSDDEIACAKKEGFVLMSLGPYTLRSETAAIAAVSRITAMLMEETL